VKLGNYIQQLLKTLLYNDDGVSASVAYSTIYKWKRGNPAYIPVSLFVWLKNRNV